MALKTLENQINTEWNRVRAWVATHQTISLVGVGIALWLFGHFRWPI